MTYRVDSNLSITRVGNGESTVNLKPSDHHFVAHNGQTLVLPTLVGNLDREVWCKLGDVYTTGVTINTADPSETIEGDASVTIDTDYGYVALLATSSGWVVTSSTKVKPPSIGDESRNIATTSYVKGNMRVGLNEVNASHTLTLSDEGSLILFTGLTADAVLTIPLEASVNFPLGTQMMVTNATSFNLSITPTAGVNLNSSGATGTRTLSAQYSGASLIKTATDTWYLFGDLG
jgi:hypothetical protein